MQCECPVMADIVAKSKIERTIAIRFSLDETMDVGEEKPGMPAIEEYSDKMPFKFTGVLKKRRHCPWQKRTHCERREGTGRMHKRLATVRD